MFHSLVLLVLLAAVNGCSNDPSAAPSESSGADTNEPPATDSNPLLGDAGKPEASDASARNLLVRLGVPDPEDPLAFAPLPEDGHVKIRMGGQGGTHAILGLQCSGFGNRILYEIRIAERGGDGAVSTPTLPAPRPIFCDSEGLCKLVPINVVIGGLAPPEEWPGLEVSITLTVSNADGLSATTSAEGYLDPT